MHWWILFSSEPGLNKWGTLSWQVLFLLASHNCFWMLSTMGLSLRYPPHGRFIKLSIFTYSWLWYSLLFCGQWLEMSSCSCSFVHLLYVMMLDLSDCRANLDYMVYFVHILLSTCWAYATQFNLQTTRWNTSLGCHWHHQIL